MPEEELEGQGTEEGLSPEEQAMMAEYEAEGEVPEGEGEPEPPVEAIQAELEPQAEATVPSYRLKEEADRRREAERKLELLAQRTDTLLSQIQQVTAPSPEQPPDREEDPVGYLTWQNEQLLQRLDYQTQTQQQTTEQQTQQRAAEAFWNDYNAGVNEYARKTPDYSEAIAFLTDSRRKELAALGCTDPAEQDNVLWQESFQIAALAKQRGQNHAEIFYNLARGRGYKGGQPITQPVNQPAVQPKQNLDNVRRGAQAATSLSNMGGAGEEELSAEALISMTDEEFQAATSGKKWNRLHGR